MRATIATSSNWQRGCTIERRARPAYQRRRSLVQTAILAGQRPSGVARYSARVNCSALEPSMRQLFHSGILRSIGSPARPAGPRKPLEGPISHRNTLAECGRALRRESKLMASQSPVVTQQGPPRPLTYEGAAERCGVTIRTLQRAAVAGELRVIRYAHRTVRIDPADLLAWVTSRKSGIRCTSDMET
jgi:excisionase family DNA binding protein